MTSTSTSSSPLIFRCSKPLPFRRDKSWQIQRIRPLTRYVTCSSLCRECSLLIVLFSALEIRPLAGGWPHCRRRNSQARRRRHATIYWRFNGDALGSDWLVCRSFPFLLAEAMSTSFGSPISFSSLARNRRSGPRGFCEVSRVSGYISFSRIMV